MTTLTDDGIRKAGGNDFNYIRRLPVQLTQPATTSLQLKQLRMMMQVADHELFVRYHNRQLSVFLALHTIPSADSAIRFLLIKHLAAGRTAFDQGAAAEMAAFAQEKAQAAGCKALLVRAATLSLPAIKFYTERGFIRQGNALIKNL